MAGLLDSAPSDGRADMLAALRSTLTSAPPPTGDDAVAERRQQMERERSELRLTLRAAGEQAALLDSMDGDEQEYEGVVGQQISRLRVSTCSAMWPLTGPVLCARTRPMTT